MRISPSSLIFTSTPGKAAAACSARPFSIDSRISLATWLMSFEPVAGIARGT